MASDLSAYIPQDRRRARARGASLPDRASGAAMFADVTGFTPLAEALARAHGPRRGAEELTTRLNQVYEALTDAVHTYGGSVVGFSGDAMTCWFDDAERLAARDWRLGERDGEQAPSLQPRAQPCARWPRPWRCSGPCTRSPPS